MRPNFTLISGSWEALIFPEPTVAPAALLMECFGTAFTSDGTLHSPIRVQPRVGLAGHRQHGKSVLRALGTSTAGKTCSQVGLHDHGVQQQRSPCLFANPRSSDWTGW